MQQRIVLIVLFSLLALGGIAACEFESVQFGKESSQGEEAVVETATSEAMDATPAEETVAPEPETSPEQPAEEPPEPQGIRQLQQPCNPLPQAPLNQQCQRGLRCVRINALDAVCLQDCSQDNSVCSKSSGARTTCRHIGWTREKPQSLISVCVKVVGANEACDLSKSIDCKKDVASYLICKEGKCQEGRLATKADEPCGTFLPSPVECDISKRLTCSGHNNKCTQGYRALEGDRCSAGQWYCDPGFQCMNLTVGPEICVKQCNLGLPDDKACPFRPKFRCLPNNDGKGVCLQLNCTTPNECLYQNVPHQCYSINLQGTRTKACLPAEEGTRGLGKSCTTTGKNSCVYPFVCVEIDRGSGYSACVPTCQYTEHCKTFDPRMVCNAVNRVCMWQCKDNSDCPKVMECAPLGACGSKNPSP